MKRNKATRNRPEGDRLIEAPFLQLDLNDVVEQLKDERSWKEGDRNGITLFKTPGLTVVLTCMHDETVIEDIAVDGNMILQVLDGRVNVTTDMDAFVVCQEQMVVLQPNVHHTIYALKTATVLMIHCNQRKRSRLY